MQIHKKFAFDQSVPQAEFEKYINPDDLLNESFEKMKGEFEAYRRKRGKDIIREEVQQRRKIQESRKKNQSSPQFTADDSKKIMGAINVLIRQQEQKCKIIHKQAQQPNFGIEHQMEKQKIQKTDIQKQPIFSEADFQRLIQKEEEEEDFNQTFHKTTLKNRKGFVSQYGKYKSWIKLEDVKQKKSRRHILGSTYHKLPNKEQIKNEIVEQASKAYDRYEMLRKTWEKFGVQPKRNLDFRVDTLQQAKLQRLLLEKPEFHVQEPGTYQDLKSTDMNEYLLRLMTNPVMNEQVQIQRNLIIHEERVKRMRMAASQQQRATR